MSMEAWCEHLDKVSKYTVVNYVFDSREITLRVQTWVCPECGVHGAASEIVQPQALLAK